MPYDIKKYEEKLDEFLQKKNSFTDALQFVEGHTGVQKKYIALGMMGVLVLWLMFGYGSMFLANLIGFVYPAYCSVLAIETHDKSDDTKWLTYWTVYGFFGLLEFFTDIFLFWIPLYSFLKCLFFLFLMAPTSWNGSVMIYNRVLLPFVKKHQARIDEELSRLSGAGKSLASDVAMQGMTNYAAGDPKDD